MGGNQVLHLTVVGEAVLTVQIRKIVMTSLLGNLGNS